MSGMVNSSGGVSGAQYATERMVRTVSMQKDVMDQAGRDAIRLIQSATLSASQGQSLDIKV